MTLESSGTSEAEVKAPEPTRATDVRSTLRTLKQAKTRLLLELVTDPPAAHAEKDQRIRRHDDAILHLEKMIREGPLKQGFTAISKDDQVFLAVAPEKQQASPRIQR